MHRRPPVDPLSYAGPSTKVSRRRRMRLALAAAATILLTPLLAAAMIAAVEWRVLPQHFLCCNHPEVAIAGLVVLPSLGALCGLVSIGRLALGRGTFKGWVPAVVGALVNPLLALGGSWLCSAFRA
jgi:hypothetical protein